jgi:hypothetical protein
MNETTVQHRSFSAFTSWLRCGKAFQLERILQAPSEPAWWFAGGSAFHLAVEKFLHQKYEASKVPVTDAPPF